VRVDGNGWASWGSRVTALRSEQVGWSTQGQDCTKVVENPAVVRDPGSGIYYLWFSTGNWQSKDYATGIARCSANSIPTSACQVWPRSDIPYYGCTCRNGPQPLLYPPGNKPGPGGMTPYWSYGDGLRVVWHWFLEPAARFPQNDKLQYYPGLDRWVIG
jgi:hypothetical protein